MVILPTDFKTSGSRFSGPGNARRICIDKLGSRHESGQIVRLVRTGVERLSVFPSDNRLVRQPVPVRSLADTMRRVRQTTVSRTPPACRESCVIRTEWKKAVGAGRRLDDRLTGFHDAQPAVFCSFGLWYAPRLGNGGFFLGKADSVEGSI